MESIQNNQNLASLDYLTGLVNRRGIYEYYASLDKKSLIHAMFIDIDNFKRVNDIYGHSIGDKLLICISQLISENTRSFAARMGGDEYVVLFDASCSEESIIDISERMLTGMQTLDFRKDILSLVSLSIGIVMNQSVSQQLDDILAKCDAAMYQAKYDGKNRYTIYKEFEKTIEINRNIELEMEDALANGEFEVYFQPKVNMITTDLYGAEALSRWIHPADAFARQTPISLFLRKMALFQSWICISMRKYAVSNPHGAETHTPISRFLSICPDCICMTASFRIN